MAHATRPCYNKRCKLHLRPTFVKFYLLGSTNRNVCMHFHYAKKSCIHMDLITIFVNLGLFWHFETITNIKRKLDKIT